MSTLNGGPGNIVTNGLVMYLDAANYASYTSGSLTWYDLTKNNNSGSLINGPIFDSGNAGSIVFDGSNDYIALPNGILSGTGDFTVIQWVQSNGSAVGTTLGNYPAGNFQFGWSQNYVFMYLGNSTAYASNSNFTTAITMIAGRRIGITTNYLKNGAVISTGSSSISIGTSSTVFRMGLTTNGGETYTGKIFNTLIYNRGLSDLEILQNYNAQKSRFGLT